MFPLLEHLIFLKGVVIFVTAAQVVMYEPKQYIKAPAFASANVLYSI